MKNDGTTRMGRDWTGNKKSDETTHSSSYGQWGITDRGKRMATIIINSDNSYIMGILQDRSQMAGGDVVCQKKHIEERLRNKLKTVA